MQRWLSVEDHVIFITEVPFYYVVEIKVGVCEIPSVGQVDLLSIMADDVLSSRPSRWSIAYQLSHLIDVLLCDWLWHCEISGDILWDSELI